MYYYSLYAHYSPLTAYQYSVFGNLSDLCVLSEKTFESFVVKKLRGSELSS